MAVQNDTSRIQYNGNNSTVNAYAIPFPFFENSHIRAVVTTSAGVDTTLSLGTGYTLTGAGNPNGGSLRTDAAVPSSSKVTIFRDVPATQTTSYQEGGDFPAASHERALDKLTMVAQQNQRLGERSIRVSEAGTSPSELTALPNTVLGLDANRNPKAMTVDEVKSYLALTGTTLDVNAGLKTFADSGERALAVPEFTGQLATQRDTNAVYVSTGTNAGNWQLFNVTDSLVTPTSAYNARTLSEHLSDSVNVLDYGAKPNPCNFFGTISGTTLTVTFVATGFDAGGFPLRPQLEVGMYIDTAPVAPLTRIEEVLTGSGGIGTYRVNQSQTVAGQNMQAFFDNRLAIQRAICGSKFPISAAGVQNWTFDTLMTINWNESGSVQRRVPALIREAGPGGRPVHLPFGRYKISGPLTVSQGTRIVGENVPLQAFRTQQFTFIEDFAVWVQRQESGPDQNGNIVSWDTPWHLVNRASFNANCVISGLRLQGECTRNDTMQYSWYHWPLYQESGYTTCAGTSGGTTITLTGQSFSYGVLRVGMKFRVKGFNAVYTIGSVASNVITLASGETLANTFSGAILMIGRPAQNGITISGGENSSISQVYANNMFGTGIGLWHGSPGHVIRDCMCNGNDIAYEIDVGPALLIKPSGDGNNSFLTSGMRGYCQTTCIGAKIEDPRVLEFGPVPNPSSNPTNIVYPYLETLRDTFCLGAGQHLIVGGTQNAEQARWNFEAGQSMDIPFINLWSGIGFDIFPKYNIIGFQEKGFGIKLIRGRNANTGAIYRSIARSEEHDTMQNHLGGNHTPFIEGAFTGEWPENHYNLRFRSVRNNNNQSTWTGILCDQGSALNNESSGMKSGHATFTRSTTTVTFTYNNHGLSVGDYVKMERLFDTDVAANFTPQDTNGTTAYPNRIFRVNTVATNTFTVSVADAGPTTGKAIIIAQQYSVFHDIKDGCHRIQLPSDTGDTTVINRPGFLIIDKQRRHLAGLRVFSPLDAIWWTRQELTVGGTMPDPLAAIKTRTATVNMSGASVTVTGFSPTGIPSGAYMLGATVRVLTSITGATSFDVGDIDDDDAWGAGISLAAGTTTSSADFTITQMPIYRPAKSIILKANGSNFSGGSVKVDVAFMVVNAPQP
jgi:hypothetical protein